VAKVQVECGACGPVKVSEGTHVCPRCSVIFAAVPTTFRVRMAPINPPPREHGRGARKPKRASNPPAPIHS